MLRLSMSCRALHPNTWRCCCSWRQHLNLYAGRAAVACGSLQVACKPCTTCCASCGPAGLAFWRRCAVGRLPLIEAAYIALAAGYPEPWNMEIACKCSGEALEADTDTWQDGSSCVTPQAACTRQPVDPLLSQKPLLPPEHSCSSGILFEQGQVLGSCQHMSLLLCTARLKLLGTRSRRSRACIILTYPIQPAQGGQRQGGTAPSLPPLAAMLCLARPEHLGRWSQAALACGATGLGVPGILAAAGGHGHGMCSTRCEDRAWGGALVLSQPLALGSERLAQVEVGYRVWWCAGQWPHASAQGLGRRARPAACSVLCDAKHTAAALPTPKALLSCDATARCAAAQAWAACGGTAPATSRLLASPSGRPSATASTR